MSAGFVCALLNMKFAERRGRTLNRIKKLIPVYCSNCKLGSIKTFVNWNLRLVWLLCLQLHNSKKMRSPENPYKMPLSL